MNREIHVRICESLRGQFPRATRPDRPCCLTLSSGLSEERELIPLMRCAGQTFIEPEMERIVLARAGLR
jgi:hypothetical protein